MGKGKNDDMGCVGFGAGGFLKHNKIHVFSTADNDPESVLSEHREYYGKTYTMKYINTDNPEKILKKYTDKFEDDDCNYENVFTASNKTASDLLRSFAGENKPLKTFGRKPKSKKSKDDDDEDDDDDKKKSKSKGKKDTKSKKSKKESDDESESDNDAKKKKSSKKPVKKSKKDESDGSGSDSD